MSTSEPLSENDKVELEKFALYLRATARWDNANDDLPDFSPITETQRRDYMMKRIKAHADIYEQIYGERP